MKKATEEISWVAFTETGIHLMEKLAAVLGGQTARAHGNPAFSLRCWTEEAFSSSRALVFIGAAGIAVRAVAPLLTAKTADPAVIVLDETGRFVIPLVSGHLGGANRLSRTIAGITGGEAVITTATDVNGLFAIDSWAEVQGLTLRNPERVKALSARLLSGGPISVYSAFPITGSPPAGVVLSTSPETADAAVDFHPHPAALTLVPPALVLGLGCRRNTTAETLRRVVGHFLTQSAVLPEALAGICSIQLKQDEPGLRVFAEGEGLPLFFFTAEELQETPGRFTHSDYVEQITGVDNVCERSAVRGAGGPLIIPKFKEDGVTLALAEKPVRLDWSW